MDILGGIGWVVDVVSKAASPFVEAGAGIIVGVLTAIGSYALSLGQSLLSWVISPNFMGVTMTGPDNPFVTLGWSVVRDLANIIIVLALIIISLGIILGMEDYKAKKTLPVLLVIAILINFTPVICGFIIDFTNNLMGWLLKGGLRSDYANAVSEGMGNMIKQDVFATIAIAAIYFIFAMLGAIIYGLYFVIFIARYIFLWILIIVSPIAFVSRIFPPSDYVKRFFPSFFSWKEWWSAFLQWCTIGIYAAFFIFLANQMMMSIASGTTFTSAPTGSLSMYGAILGHLLPMILLLIGFFTSIEAAEAGMSVIPGMQKSLAQFKGPALVAGSTAVGAAAGLTVGASRGAQKEKGWRRAWGAVKGGAKGAATGKGREEGVKWYKKQAEKIPYVGITPGTYEADLRKAVSEEENRLEKVAPEELNYLASEKVVLTKEGRIRRAAALNVLTKRGKLDNKNMKYAEESKTFGFDAGEASKRRPSQAARFADKPIDKMTNIEKLEEVEKAVNKQTASDFAKNIQVDELSNAQVIAAMDLDKLRVLGDKGSRDKKEALRQFKKTKTGVFELNKIANDLIAHRNSATTPQEIAEAENKIKKFRFIVEELEDNPNFK